MNTLEEIRDQRTAFIGVNEGYNGAAFDLKTVEGASLIVKAQLDLVGLKGDVFPGRVAWGKHRGCPENGEVVGAVLLSKSQDFKDQLGLLDVVRKNLKQTTVSVIDPSREFGVPAHRVSLKVDNVSLDEIAHRWHDLADPLNDKLGLHVSAGFWKKSEGLIFAEVTANPSKVTDPVKWAETASHIIRQLQDGGYSVQSKPQVVGFNYLRD